MVRRRDNHTQVEDYRIRPGLGGLAKHAERFPFVVDYGKMQSTEQYQAKKDWCRDHCEAECEVFYNRAGFASESDATLFVIRWR